MVFSNTVSHKDNLPGYHTGTITEPFEPIAIDHVSLSFRNERGKIERKSLCVCVCVCVCV